MYILIKLIIKLGLLKYFNIIYNKNNTKIPLIGGMGYENFFGTEQWMKSVLDKLIPISTGCFIDVGTNIGQTLIKIRNIDKEIKYIGFEPNPACIYYVDKLIDANGYQNCEVIPCGISKHNEIITLNSFYKDKADSSASIIEDFRPNQTIVFKSNILAINDEMINKWQNIAAGIIKIDVEGAELYVIEGLYRMLKEYRPFIIVEILPVYSSDNLQGIERQAMLLKIMNELNYVILRIMKNELNNFVDFKFLDSIPIHNDISESDYVFVPNEKYQYFKQL